MNAYIRTNSDLFLMQVTRYIWKTNTWECWKMCLNAKKSSPEVIETIETVALSRLSSFNFDELSQLTTIHSVPRALTQNRSNKTRKLVAVDHDLGDDGWSLLISDTNFVNLTYYIKGRNSLKLIDTTKKIWTVKRIYCYRGMN